MTLVEEAQLVAGKKTFKEIEALTEGRQRTDIEHLAYMFAMQREIEERIASKKARAAKKEAEYDSEREKAESLYINAKEELRIEKDRHYVMEESFAEEKTRYRSEKERHLSMEASFAKGKARHRAERDRHSKAVAQFQREAKPWRDIMRAEKEAERATQAEADKGIDDFLAENS